ncbi:MAG: hypothetical protein FWD58_07445 [Firmicutes bacterium]|nr:hypothetical protein [Bacillota bacterium]
MQHREPFSLGMIIVAWIFIWPIAVYMIISNVLISVAQSGKNSTAAGYINPHAQKNPIRPKNFTGLKVIGGFLIGLGVLLDAIIIPVGIYSSLESGDYRFIISAVFFFVFFIAFGIMLCCIASAQAKKSRLKLRYVDIINGASDLSIADLALQAGQSEQKALKVIERMLDERYFPNCHIDRGTMTFCFPRPEDAEKYGYQSAVVSCPSCGSVNMLLAGTSRRCSHCGSPIKAELPESPAPSPTPEKTGPKKLGDSIRETAASASGAAKRFLDNLFNK